MLSLYGSSSLKHWFWDFFRMRDPPHLISQRICWCWFPPRVHSEFISAVLTYTNFAKITVYSMCGYTIKNTRCPKKQKFSGVETPSDLQKWRNNLPLFQGKAEQDHGTPRGVRHKGKPYNQSVASPFFGPMRENCQSYTLELFLFRTTRRSRWSHKPSKWITLLFILILGILLLLIIMLLRNTRQFFAFIFGQDCVGHSTAMLPI
jgi:hypothetical protein